METKNSSQYPFEYQELPPEENEELKKCFAPLFSKIIRLGPKGYLFYKEFEDTIVDIYNIEVRPSDTFVLTYPRSGTTWTQDLVWLLQNNLDFQTAKSIPLPLRFPFLESGSFLKFQSLEDVMPTESESYGRFLTENVLYEIKSLSTMKSPRFMKCHLPLSLLPPSLLETAKASDVGALVTDYVRDVPIGSYLSLDFVVYVARDPRDVAVSNFFHMKSTPIVINEAEFKTFWNFFIQDKVLWCPYFEHVKEAWNLRNHPNMTFIFYEELSKDLPAVARRLATFFGKQYSDEQYQALCNHLKFDNFKNNTSVNLKEWKDAGFITGNFIRKGKSGGWREHFDAEMTQQAERWIADNLRDTDLRFPDIQ